MTSTSVTTSSTSRRSSASALDTLLAGTPVHALWTRRRRRETSGRSARAPAPGDRARRSCVRRLRQVHGAQVLVVDGARSPTGPCPGRRGRGRRCPPEGDALVATGDGFALAVLTADCASVALGSPEGVHGAVHVGWRGLGGRGARAGRRRHAALGRQHGGGRARAVHRPVLLRVLRRRPRRAARRRAGPRCAVVTTWGRPSLDLPAAVRGQLSRSGASIGGRRPTRARCAPRGTSRTAAAATRPARRCSSGVGPERAVVAGSVPRVLATAPPADVVMARVGGAAPPHRGRGTRPGRRAHRGGDKGFTSSAVDAARACGLYDIGENYADELLAKVAPAADAADGTDAATDRLHDGADVATRPDALALPRCRAASTRARPRSGGVVVADGEPGGGGRGHRVARAGCHGPRRGGRPPELRGATAARRPRSRALVASLREQGLDVRGLMTVGPPGPPEEARPAFRLTAHWPTTSGFPRCRWG